MSDGYKTRGRDRILEVLKSNKDRTVDVNDIMRSLSEEGNDVNVTTVYRYLDKLCTEKSVLRYVAENGTRAVYQYVGDQRHCDEHLHMQCTRCGAIIHLDCHFMDEIASHVRNEHGFHIQCRNSIIYGLCEKCFTDTMKDGDKR